MFQNNASFLNTIYVYLNYIYSYLNTIYAYFGTIWFHNGTMQHQLGTIQSHSASQKYGNSFFLPQKFKNPDFFYQGGTIQFQDGTTQSNVGVAAITGKKAKGKKPREKSSIFNTSKQFRFFLWPPLNLWGQMSWQSHQPPLETQYNGQNPVSNIGSSLASDHIPWKCGIWKHEDYHINIHGILTSNVFLVISIHIQSCGSDFWKNLLLFSPSNRH